MTLPWRTSTGNPSRRASTSTASPVATDARRANKDHFQRTAWQGSLRSQDGGIDLATVGIALHCRVEDAETALRGVRDFTGEQDGLRRTYQRRACARTELFQRIKEVVLVEELEHRGRFTAGQNRGRRCRRVVPACGFRMASPRNRIALRRVLRSPPEWRGRRCVVGWIEPIFFSCAPCARVACGSVPMALRKSPWGGWVGGGGGYPCLPFASWLSKSCRPYKHCAPMRVIMCKPPAVGRTRAVARRRTARREKQRRTGRRPIEDGHASE